MFLKKVLNIIYRYGIISKLWLLVCFIFIILVAYAKFVVAPGIG